MPPTVAVLGASADRAKFGNKSLRAHLQAGYDAYPVNLRNGEFEGLRAYRRLAEVPVDLDRITVYLPPETTRALIPEMAAKGAREVYFNPGSTTPEVTRAAREAGLPVREACSIVALGLSPAMF